MSPVPEEERDKPVQQAGNEIEDTEYPDVVINAGSSESEEDDEGDGGYMGYQALTQNVGGADTDNEDEVTGSGDEGEPAHQNQGSGPTIDVSAGTGHLGLYQDFPNTAQLPNYMQVPDVPRPDKIEILWNQPRSTDIGLETGQADKIKSLMTGFQLPSSNIPDWAKTLSDDQWQAQVVNRLVTNKKTSLNQEVSDTSCNQIENTCDTETGKQS